MSGTNSRDSIDLSEEEKQLKEAGVRPESFNWYQLSRRTCRTNRGAK